MVALKTLVVVMGILIVLGIGVLGYGMYQKAQNPDFRFFTAEKEALPPAAPAPQVAPTPQMVPTLVPREPLRPFGDIAVTVPEGCEIVDMKPFRRLLHLRIGSDRACSRVIVVDLRRGKVLGTISVEP